MTLCGSRDDHLRRVQNTKIRTTLKVKVYIHFLSCYYCHYLISPVKFTGPFHQYRSQ